MTMSLSVARPILTAPGVDSSALPGRRIFIIDVAMTDESPPPIRLVGGAAGSAAGADGAFAGGAR
jgi:hypothetical protein